MKHKLLIIFGMVILLFQFAFSQQEDQTESPYFFVPTENVNIEDFPLQSTRADVNIVGPIADVKVTQTYANNGEVPIEAIYVFPGSTRSAVYAMKMKIGDRVIEARIKEKQQAREQYERARSEGRRASLLEQHKPNVFQMNVANILPGDIIEVELSYTEFLVPESGEYKFVYPTVVGPRFGDKEAEEGIPTFVSIPYTKNGIQASYEFDIKLIVNMGMPIRTCQSNSHNVDIDYVSGIKALVSLNPMDVYRGNKDFILKYSLADSQIESGTMFFDDGNENFFLTMIEPPKRFESIDIPSREFIFVVDVSGSMHGFPIDISKKLMKELLSDLRENDVFNVLLFASNSSVLSDRSLPATKENIMKAVNLVDNESGSGGTSLLPAMERAFKMANDPDRSSSIIVVTDGYIHVEEETFRLITNNLNKANVFTFGIGSGVNRYLIEGMAHVGRGEPFVIPEKKYAFKTATRFRKYIEHPVLTDVSLSFSGIEVYDLSPVNTPDVLAERPVYVFGKYRGNPSGSVVIEGTTGTGRFLQEFDLSRIQAKASNKALKYLWAREKIRELSDFNAVHESEERKKEITQLGLNYNLLTKYTSFLAEEKVAAMVNGEKIYQVKQPLPLPEGVSNFAVGFEMGFSKKKKFGNIAKPAGRTYHFESQVTPGDRVLLKSLFESFIKALKLTDKEYEFTVELSNTGVVIIDPNQVLDQPGKLKLINLIRTIISGRNYNNGILFTIKS